MEFFWRGTGNAGIMDCSAASQRRHGTARKAAPRGQSAPGRAATPCGVKAAIQEGWGAPGMQDESCQDGRGCELFGTQGAENTASQLTNKKPVLFCKGSLQTSAGCGVPKRGKKPLPVGAAAEGRMQRMHREIGLLRVTSPGRDGSAGLTFQKKEKGGAREGIKSGWQKQKMIVWLCKKLP